MPKKRSYNFKALQGASSTQNGHARAENATQNSRPSVNERLEELRQQQTAAAAQRKRELAELVNQKSVPPLLRGILGVPESAPPKPKPGATGGRRTRGVRATPGPAPPQSWLQASQKDDWGLKLTLRPRGRRFSAPSTERSGVRHSDRIPLLNRFARLTALVEPNGDTAPPRLFHLALRTAAQQWSLFDEADYPMLAELPARLRVQLISYIAYYGPTIDLHALEALTAGEDEIQSLDLAGLIGHGSLTISQLIKTFKADADVLRSPEVSRVAESWDQAGGESLALVPGLVKPQFSQLTHLSLADHPSGGNWKALLALSRYTPLLTHLSLARWSRPTLTPNLIKTTVSSKLGLDVAAGGSHYYSELDQDFREPWSILRQLSNNLLCLQWLDLEGCTDWVPGLAYRSSSSPNASVLNSDEQADCWARQAWISNPFVDTWKNVEYVRCGQGWLPTLTGLAAVRSDAEDRQRQRLIGDIEKSMQAVASLRVAEDEDDPFDIARRRAEIWVQCELKACVATNLVNVMRRAESCKPIRFDYGWRRTPA
ncbi:hypothetical protein MRB53_042007 [Persea americana]|nr:hypothetical protein MRB53_042007 [Persea americana]